MRLFKEKKISIPIHKKQSYASKIKNCSRKYKCFLNLLIKEKFSEKILKKTENLKMLSTTFRKICSKII